MSRRWLTLPMCAIALALLTATPVAAAKPESFDFEQLIRHRQCRFVSF